MFPGWSSWLWHGDARVELGTIARTGKRSCLLRSDGDAKIRIFRHHKQLVAGRYRVTAYIRGLDIGTGKWKQSTEFAFAGRYFQLGRRGSFGWSKLTYVGDVERAAELSAPSFGLMATGSLWIDDVTLERVGPEVALTEKPELGQPESEISGPDLKGKQVLRCERCQYKIAATAKRCHVCGAPIAQAASKPQSSVQLLESFERVSLLGGFSNGDRSSSHATHGQRSFEFSGDSRSGINSRIGRAMKS